MFLNNKLTPNFSGPILKLTLCSKLLMKVHYVCVHMRVKYIIAPPQIKKLSKQHTLKLKYIYLQSYWCTIFLVLNISCHQITENMQ